MKASGGDRSKREDPRSDPPAGCSLAKFGGMLTVGAPQQRFRTNQAIERVPDAPSCGPPR